MKEISTIMRSRLKIVGSRECESCGGQVPIIQTVRNEQEVEVSECLQCEDQKVQQRAEEFYERREIEKTKVIFQKYSMASEDLVNASFETFIADDPSKEDAKAKAEWYAKHFEELEWKSLLFQGAYGVGKSHLAHSIAKALEGHTVIFINVPALLTLFRESYNNASFSESELLSVMKDVDLLILDDIGAEYIKQDNKESWATDKLFQIINSRVGKPMIYTTNCDSAELKAKYGVHGGRIVSRIMQGTKVIKMTGKDMRMV